jgi:hypothetical protein
VRVAVGAGLAVVSVVVSVQNRHQKKAKLLARM